MTSRHHIVQLHTNPAWGGGEYQVLNTVKGLEGRHIRTTLFTHPYGKLMVRAEDAGLQVKAIPAVAFMPFLPFSLSSLCRIMKELEVDLVHAHDSLAATIGTGVHKRTGIPVVLSRRIASPVRPNFFSQRKYSEDNFAAVIAISETVRQVFGTTSCYPLDKIFVAPTGIDIDEVDSTQSNPAFRSEIGGTYLVAGIGKLSHKKNWQFMLRVAARIAKTGPDVHWCLAGEGPEASQLEMLAGHLNIADRFHFLGFRPDATRILKSADALFFPSLMEGASVTVRTAMVTETPVIAVNAPGTVESLDGHGWIVTPDDIEGAAISVVDALTNTAKRAAICTAARESAVNRFSFNRTVEDTISIYGNVFRETPDTQ